MPLGPIAEADFQMFVFMRYIQGAEYFVPECQSEPHISAPMVLFNTVMYLMLGWGIENPIKEGAITEPNVGMALISR